MFSSFDKGQHQMLRKVCMEVGHDVEHGVEHDAEPKNGKNFDFFKIF